MDTGQQIAAQLREVYIDGTWVANTNFTQALADVTWEQATQPVAGLNTIALLTFHIDYYLAGVLQVLNGGTLDIRDRYSFDMPPIAAAADWDALRTRLGHHAEQLADRIATLDAAALAAPFVDAKYGTYYRNMHGLIEHGYYHLGQVVLLRKLLQVI